MVQSKPQVPDIVKAILMGLKDAGFEAYVVGGAVRDMVMGREPVDWDVATSAAPGDVEERFSHLTRFSLRHGTTTLVHEGANYEVSSFRGSVPTIEDDLAHRDFTINAMAWDPDQGKVIDPWGGRRDLERRLLRAVGIPEDRFREDPLRLLRAARIACELGLRIHPKTRDALSGMAHLLSTVAGERVRDELIRIMIGARPASGFREMARSNLLKEILPGFENILGHPLETMERVPPTPALRLAALFHDIAKSGSKDGDALEGARIAAAVMRRLRFSEPLISKVSHLVKHHRDAVNYAPSWDDGAVRRLMRRVGAEHLGPFFALCQGDLESEGRDTRPLLELRGRVRRQVAAGRPYRVRDLKVNGRKVMEVCGIRGGPEVGRILEALLEEVMDHPEWNTEEKLLDRLKKMG